MSKIQSILDLLRIRQYYKNILIFIGAFFAFRILSIRIFPTLIVGFFLLCCASSINYIINDLKDVEKDKLHDEKVKKKPLASGELGKGTAIFLLIILFGIIIFAFVTSITLSFPNFYFMLILCIFIISGQLYNHLFKKYAFVDMIVLSLQYLWRTLAGCILIEVNISPWLLLAIFELAMFLGISKRKGDLILLGDEKAVDHKEVYEEYSITLLDQFQTVIASSVFMTYALYLIIRFNIFAPETVVTPEVNDLLLFLTLPILLYVLMRYMYITNAKPEIARSTEKVITDRGLVIGALFFAGIITYVFYFDAALEYGLTLFNR